MLALKRSHQSDKFLAAECGRTAKLRGRAFLDNSRDPLNMIIVPVCCQDECNRAAGVDTHVTQKAQRSRLPIYIRAGIDNNPLTGAEMQHNAFTISRTNECKLEFPLSRRDSHIGQGSITAVTFFAHSLPSRKSDSVILGSSRKTICDTRFRSPVGECS